MFKYCAPTFTQKTTQIVTDDVSVKCHTVMGHASNNMGCLP